jgi:hypothetical protein
MTYVCTFTIYLPYSRRVREVTTRLEAGGMDGGGCMPPTWSPDVLMALL